MSGSQMSGSTAHLLSHTAKTSAALKKQVITAVKSSHGDPIVWAQTRIQKGDEDVNQKIMHLARAEHRAGKCLAL